MAKLARYTPAELYKIRTGEEPPVKSEHVNSDPDYWVEEKEYTHSDFFKKFRIESTTQIGSHIGFLYVLSDKEKPSERIYCLGNPIGPYHYIK